MEAFERISHLFLREVDTDAALGHGFGVPVVRNDGVARRLGVVDVSSRSSHLEIWYISFTILYLAVTFSVFGCCFRYAEHWILRVMTWSMGAMFGSTVDTYSTLVLGWLLEEFHDFLRDWVDSVPQVESRLISPCRHTDVFPTIAGRSGRARRHSRQWHAVPGFADIFAFRASFPMNAGRCSVWSLTRPLCTTTGVMVQTVQFLDKGYSARSLTRPLCTTTGVMVQTVQFLDKVARQGR